MRTLNLLLDFDEQYRRDQQQSSDFLHRRDRRLAVDQGIDGSRRSLAAWLHAVRGQPDATAPDVERLRAWRWMRVLFALAGVVFGAGAMLGLLYYHGGQRINVTLIMAVAMVQLLLALLTMAEALIGWQPWRGLSRNLMARWWPAFAHPGPTLRGLAAPLAARVAQTGGLAFGVTALVVLLGQVVIHDLAFGWSTTLQASAPAYHALTNALAWPWRDWLPGAVPSLQLVAQSRFFRSGAVMAANPELLGIWWRFLAMMWLCYVVIPRALLLGMTRVQLALRVRRLLARHPARVALRERCATPWIDSGDDVGSGVVAATDRSRQTPSAAIAGRILVRWAEAGDPGLAQQWLGAGAVSLDAGGAAGLDVDRAALEQARLVGGPVIVVARGWEPPTGELADFLEAVCKQPGKGPIQLLPLAAGSVPVLVDEPVLAPWRRFVERLDQPAIVVADVPGAESRQ